jgi:hypothetical protein
MAWPERSGGSGIRKEVLSPRITAANKEKKMGRTLQHVDVIELKAFQAELDRVKDVLPAQAILIHIAGVVGGLGTP